MRDIVDADLQHQAGEPRIRDNEIATASEHEQRQPTRASKLDGFHHFGFGPGFGEIASRSADVRGSSGEQAEHSRGSAWG